MKLLLPHKKPLWFESLLLQDINPGHNGFWCLNLTKLLLLIEVWLCIAACPRYHPMCNPAQQTTTTQTHAQISTLETADWNWQEQPRDSICKLFWLPRHHVLAAFYLYQIAVHRRDSSKTTGLLSKVFTGSHQSRISTFERVNLGTHCSNVVASTWLLFFFLFIFFFMKSTGPAPSSYC